MKIKSLYIIVFCISIILLFAECKKSKEDPAISFRSRNQRICGQWQLSSLAGTKLMLGTTYNYSFSGGNYTISYTTDSLHIITYNSYDFQMNIKKDNTIQINEAYSNSSNKSISITTNLYWNWLDIKKKTLISLPFDDFEIPGGDEWNIIKLSHKQIILNYYYSSTSSSNNNYSSDITLTFNLVK